MACGGSAACHLRMVVDAVDSGGMLALRHHEDETPRGPRSCLSTGSLVSSRHQPMTGERPRSMSVPPGPVPASDAHATRARRLAYPRPCRASMPGAVPSCTQMACDPRLRRFPTKATLRARSIESNGSNGRQDDALTATARDPSLAATSARIAVRARSELSATVAQLSLAALCGQSSRRVLRESRAGLICSSCATGTASRHAGLLIRYLHFWLM